MEEEDEEVLIQLAGLIAGGEEAGIRRQDRAEECQPEEDDDIVFTST